MIKCEAFYLVSVGRSFDCGQLNPQIFTFSYFGGVLTSFFLMIILGSPIIYHDIRSHRIPNSLVAMMCVSALLLDLEFPVNQMISRLFGGVFISIIAIALLLISGGGLGMGDVKLIIALGLCMGNFQRSLSAIFVSLIIGLIWMLISRKRIIPFAPALLVGFISSNFWL